MPGQLCQHVEIESLRQAIARLEGAAPGRAAASLSSGSAALDAILPERGFRRGTLVEWLAAGDGAGATTLALRAAAEACRLGGTLVVVDPSGEFYPPAALRLAIDSAQLIVVHAQGNSDRDWAVDQALRCPAVAAVLTWPEAPGGRLDGRTFRRFQLAAEEGGALGLLVRPEAARHQPSWADVRLLVESLPCCSPYGTSRRFGVLLLRCRGGADGRRVEVEIHDETHPVSESV